MNALFRRTPEILFVTAIILLPINLYRSISAVLSMVRSGINLAGPPAIPQFIESIFVSLFVPAVLLGLAAIVASLRETRKG